MKKLVIVMMLMLAVPALAAEQSTIEMGGNLGIAIPTGDLETGLEVGVTGNLYVELYLIPEFSLRGTLGVIAANGEEIDIPGFQDYYDYNFSSGYFTADAVFHLVPEGPLSPYLMAGAGFYSSEVEMEYTFYDQYYYDWYVYRHTVDTTNFGINLGGGLEIGPFGDIFMLHFGAVYHHIIGDVEVDGGSYELENVDGGFLTLEGGASIRL